MTRRDHSSGTYVALELHKKSMAEVDDFITHVLKLENPINPAYLHSTVIYSETPVPQADHLRLTLKQ